MPYHILGFGMTADRDILPIHVGGNGEFNGTGEPEALTLGVTQASHALLFGKRANGAYVPLLVDDDGDIQIA